MVQNRVPHLIDPTFLGQVFAKLSTRDSFDSYLCTTDKNNYRLCSSQDRNLVSTQLSDIFGVTKNSFTWHIERFWRASSIKRSKIWNLEVRSLLGWTRKCAFMLFSEPINSIRLTLSAFSRASVYWFFWHWSNKTSLSSYGLEVSIQWKQGLCHFLINVGILVHLTTLPVFL